MALDHRKHPPNPAYTEREKEKVGIENCCTFRGISSEKLKNKKKVKSGSCAFVLRYFKLNMGFV